MAPKKLPEFLNESEQTLLLGYLKGKLNSREGVLSALLIRLMLNSGLRASEVINLRYRDIDWQSGKTWIREGKGKKDRAVQIAAPDLELVFEWVSAYRRGTVLPASWVFCTVNGNRLDDRWVRRVVKRECWRAGIEKDVHCHSLRHSYASDFYRQTRDLVKLQMMLGHADIRTTMVYVHLNPTEALESSNELAMARLSRRSTM